MLDNADDPYKHFRNRAPFGSGGQWFERLLLHTLMRDAGCHVLLTVRDEASILFVNEPNFCAEVTGWPLASILVEHPLGPLHDGAASELLRSEVGAELTAEDEQGTLKACGNSPLVIKVVGAMLKQLLAVPLPAMRDAKQSLIRELRSAIQHANTTASDYTQTVQDVMFTTFGYLEGAESHLVEPFLCLHIFPASFDTADAAAVCDMPVADAGRLLSRLVAYNLLAQHGHHRYMMLDHIWTFALEFAERRHRDDAPARCRLIHRFLTRCKDMLQSGRCGLLDPMITAAEFHATRWLGSSRSSGLPAADDDDEAPEYDMPVYRSLGASVYTERRREDPGSYRSAADDDDDLEPDFRSAGNLTRQPSYRSATSFELPQNTTPRETRTAAQELMTTLAGLRAGTMRS